MPVRIWAAKKYTDRTPID